MGPGTGSSGSSSLSVLPLQARNDHETVRGKFRTQWPALSKRELRGTSCGEDLTVEILIPWLQLANPERRKHSLNQIVPTWKGGDDRKRAPNTQFSAHLSIAASYFLSACVCVCVYTHVLKNRNTH